MAREETATSIAVETTIGIAISIDATTTIGDGTATGSTTNDATTHRIETDLSPASATSHPSLITMASARRSSRQ